MQLWYLQNLMFSLEFSLNGPLGPNNTLFGSMQQLQGAMITAASKGLLRSVELIVFKLMHINLHLTTVY